MTKKICVVTGTRAEYHLLTPLLRAIQDDRALELMLVVTGAHLSEHYGNTYRAIEADGFDIDAKVPILSETDDAGAVNSAMGRAITGIGEALERGRPDLMVLLGDRYEMLSAAIAAMNYRIPIAHLHGGETTEGAIDECIRHCITKMSYLHFTSCEAYRKRVIQLGESPDRVFNVGAISLENIRTCRKMSLAELKGSLDWKFDGPFAVVTFHPVTLEENTAGTQFKELLAALNRLEGLGILFTKANADSGGMEINNLIDEYVQAHPGRTVAVYSLGTERYFAALDHAAAVVGNSSSGIVETPSFRVPTVNIGDRQRGRIQAKNVINCEPEADAIYRAVSKAVSLEFRESVQDTVNPYGDGFVTKKIIKQIKRALFEGRVNLKKSFYGLH